MGRYLDQIYGEIHVITAKKTKEHVHCNLKCIQSGHMYRHKFKTTAKLLAIPDGSFLQLADGTIFQLHDGHMLVADRDY